MRSKKNGMCAGDLSLRRGDEWTRRDFLKGLSQGVSMLSMPSLLDLAFLRQEARAEGVSDWNLNTVFLGVHLANGWGNQVAPGRLGNGAFIPAATLKSVSMPSQSLTAGNLTPLGGNAIYANSAFGLAFNAAASATTRANTSFIGIHTESPDDNRSTCITGIQDTITAVGGRGPLVATTGFADSLNGAATKSFSNNPSSPYTRINRGGDLIGASSFSKEVLASPDVIQSLGRAMQRLSIASNRAELGADTQQRIYREVLGKKYDELAGSTVPRFTLDQLNATLDADAQAAFGLTATASAQVANQAGFDALFPHVAFNVAMGRNPMSQFSVTGYDVHGNARNTLNTKMQTAGRIVGQAVEIMARKVAANQIRGGLVVCTSDGGVSPNLDHNPDNAADNSNPFRGDRSNMCFWGVFAVGFPNLPPLHFGAVDATTGETAPGLIKDQKNAAGAIIALLLRANNRPELIDMALKRGGVSDADITAIKNLTAFMPS